MTDVTTIHQPVLLRDCVDLVAPALAKPGSIAVDCTLGLAGHSTAFLKASPNARQRFSKQIAREIVRRRETEPLTTSGQLNRLVDEVVPQAHRPAGNPAKRVFQALRIEVNGELDKLAGTLPQIANHLAVGGRLVVESYHSLEDKTVKAFMNQGLKVDAPADMPVVPPDMMPFFKELTRGAIKADAEEIANNPRSASVRLRAVELTRPIPARWRKRFDQCADYASMTRQGRRD